MRQDDIQSLLEADREFMTIASLVSNHIQYPWCLFSGFVRNKVWDATHGNTTATQSKDIDVGFFASGHGEFAEEFRGALQRARPDYDWDVQNFAYTHIENEDEPYTDLEDALSKELDTVMSVGVTLDHKGRVVIIAPHGTDDLAQCVIRPTPIIYAHPERLQFITDRVQSKGMLEKWPKMRVII